MKKLPTLYLVFYRVFGNTKKQVNGTFETHKDAIDDRNWWIGHMGIVRQCWVAKQSGKNMTAIGATLKREHRNGAVT